MRLSAVLSIHNRGLLFERALETYAWQTLPPDEWEIVLVDDLSTEDLTARYQPFLGRINLRHVYMDHRRHEIFRERNPSWRPGDPENWYHTPALSLNIGAWLAAGETLCLCHPEVLHAPCNFECALEWLERHPSFVFGRTYLGNSWTNAVLAERPDWPTRAWPALLQELDYLSLRAFNESELYWYTSFLPRQAFLDVGGVDFVYLNGVAAEDDDFRDRVQHAGYPPLYWDTLEGIHQDHSDETEPHRIRDTQWQVAAGRNRDIYFKRLHGGGYPEPANQDYDWRALDCIDRIVEYRVGSTEPTEIKVAA